MLRSIAWLAVSPNCGMRAPPTHPALRHLGSEAMLILTFGCLPFFVGAFVATKLPITSSWHVKFPGEAWQVHVHAVVRQRVVRRQSSLATPCATGGRLASVTRR